MSKLLIAFAAASLLAFASAGAPALAVAEPERVGYAAGELIVHFDGGESAFTAAAASIDGVSIGQIAPHGEFAIVSVPEGAEEEYASMLGRTPGVTLVERNPLHELALIPNDPLYPLQWNMPMVQAEEAWDITRGQGVVVAVVDSGIAYEDYTHGTSEYNLAPDLAGKEFVDPYNTVPLCFDPECLYHANDTDGHGTHVTGTLAQDTDNGLGVAGIAPGVTVMPVKVCLFGFCPSGQVALGVEWAVDHGADVINLSLGSDEVSEAERDAYAYAEQQGVLVVAAAGNGGEDHMGDPTLLYPAALDTVVSVGAIRHDKHKTQYSNYGSGEGHGLDLVAPGGDLLVDQNGDMLPDGVLQNTLAFGDCTDTAGLQEFSYCFYEGTSMATPHVAGAGALLKSLFPDLPVAHLRAALRCSAKDLGAAGYDEVFGYGLLQIADAIKDDDGNGVPDCLDAAGPLTPYVAMEHAYVAPGEQVTVGLLAEVDPPGLGAFTIDISYDNNVIEPKMCSSASFASCDIAYGPETVRTTAGPVATTAALMALVEITFEAKAGAGSVSPLNVELISLEDANAMDLVSSTTVVDGEVAVANVVQGDNDCDGDEDAVDALKGLQFVAALGYQQEPGCPAIGSEVASTFGDIDCDDDADAVDALQILRFVAGLPVSQGDGCPPIGEPL